MFLHVWSNDMYKLVSQCDYDRLKLSTAPFMERNLEFLIECMEDLSAEQNKV